MAANVQVPTQRTRRADLAPVLRQFGMELILIPGGDFPMGTDDDAQGDADGQREAPLQSREHPQRSVFVDDFYIGRTPVTVNQYLVYATETRIASAKLPPHAIVGMEQCPVCFVPWQDAEMYCRWLSRKWGAQFRLPTEAEWEKAARGTQAQTYPWGEAPPMSTRPVPEEIVSGFRPAYPWGEEKQREVWMCNCTNVQGRPTPVGSYQQSASPYGCLEMAGNVWEWCSDWFDPEYYHRAESDNPTGPESGINKVVRGGAYNSPTEELRCAARFYDRGEGAPFFPVGFRVVKTIE